ncbi:MAG: HAD-IA family hydrolase [Nitrospiraceae bacterium]|nr:HAD-IA family hydrolase [Nitrospiraceae bacterium]
MPQRPLVVFDIDGTLLETDRVTVPAVQRTFAAYGLPEPDAGKICSFFGAPVKDYLDWLAELCPEGKVDEIVDKTNRLELDLIAEEGRLYPGVEAMLAGLRSDGYTLALCSNGPEDYVAEFVRAYEMERFVSVVQARGDRPEGKRVMLGEILEALHERPVVVVGDRHDDVDAAHAHGALAIGARYGFGADEELRETDAQVDAADEIGIVVARLVKG